MPNNIHTAVNACIQSISFVVFVVSTENDHWNEVFYLTMFSRVDREKKKNEKWADIMSSSSFFLSFFSSFLESMVFSSFLCYIQLLSLLSFSLSSTSLSCRFSVFQNRELLSLTWWSLRSINAKTDTHSALELNAFI